MKKFVLIAFVSCFLLLGNFVYAEECSSSCNGIDECQRKIEECTKLLQMSASATKPHEEKAKELEGNINALEANIATLVKQIDKKKVDIADRSTKLEVQSKILDSQIRDYYKKDYQSPLEYFLITVLNNSNINTTARILGYRQTLINNQKKFIGSLVTDITDLNTARTKLEENQVWLAAKRASLETILAPIKKLVDEAKAYQSKLTQTVGTLSARQQQLLAEKTGNFMTSVGDVPPADDPASRPDYNPGFSPAFAAFSFGAPHRKGMSQYGAFGRAKSGQSAETILSAYYPGTELKKDYSTGITINVQGHGSYNIEDYVKRIYEVPNSWGDEGGFESLKAQAVAARSYALAYTNNGSGSICATESCQVMQDNPKGGNWERAVNDTKGWVLQSGGKPYSAWYAASSGGYNTPGGWDTKCGNQGCWTADAYEKIAGSPWFYKAWYKPRGGSGTRSHPWLNQEEFTDIANAALLYQKDNGTLSHLSQLDKSNNDRWSKDQVRQELQNRGVSPFGSVDSISVSYSTGGYTGTVTINGVGINGGNFRDVFNTRAPGELYLASTLFNIEKK